MKIMSENFSSPPLSLASEASYSVSGFLQRNIIIIASIALAFLAVCFALKYILYDRKIVQIKEVEKPPKKIHPLRISFPEDYADTAEKCIQLVRKIRENKEFIPFGSAKNFIQAIKCGMFGFNFVHPFLLPSELLKVQHNLFEQLQSEEKKLEDEICNSNLHLTAHGVEAMKGGMTSFVNIILYGLIAVQYAGPLQKGNPDCFAGSHGPFFVILNDAKPAEGEPRDHHGMIDDKYHAAYLVPNEEHRNKIFKALDDAQTAGMLTEAEKNILRSKVLIYRELLDIPSIKEENSLEHLICFIDNRMKG